MSIHQTLKNLGFSDNEAIVYLSALETGIAAAQDIAEKAGLKRTTTYSVLEALVKRGFILKTQKEGKNRYVAENPENLVKIFAEHQKNLQSALPELVAMYNAKQIKPKVLFFEGKTGIKKIYYDTIEEKPEVILEWNTSEIYQTFPGFPLEYLEMRRQRNIKAKRIAPNDKNWQERQKKDKEDISVTKLLPREEYNIPVEINVYNDKVAFMSYSDEMGLIIESRVIAEAMRTIYNLFWKKITKQGAG